MIYNIETKPGQGIMSMIREISNPSIIRMEHVTSDDVDKIIDTIKTLDGVFVLDNMKRANPEVKTAIENGIKEITDKTIIITNTI